MLPVLLISTYDMGRQPFGLASAAGSLRAAGVPVAAADLAKERLDEDVVRAAGMIAFFLPMHTATRLALPVIDRVRTLNPSARLCAYGLYAPINAELLRARGVDTIIGGEFEDDLVETALTGLRRGSGAVSSEAEGFSPAIGDARTVAQGLSPAPRPVVPRVRFQIPIRAALPPLSRYASLQIGGERRLAGYTEASRGCKHRCRHCPIVPVYDGRFRIVPAEVVLADVRSQVDAGARHVTFGDPDFFNGIRHAMDIVRAVSREFPRLSYDVTIKIEHLLRHAALLPELRATGCAFVTSAVESIDDDVLAKLEKGHTRADFERAVTLCREAGLTLAPTFVPFTPWTTPGGYCELLREIDRLGLVDHVAPIQLAIRLLIPAGSRLLELPDIRALVGAFQPDSLTYAWAHPHPEVDALQRRVAALAGVQVNASREGVFARAWDIAHEAAALPASARHDAGALPRAAVPYLNEPWYC